MNLPILEALSNDESTYITFSSALLDLDDANANDTEFYFSRVVAMRLPEWKHPDFYGDLSELIDGYNANVNPNVVLPKMIQHYLENLIRQPLENLVEDTNNHIPELTELAFYKMLNKLGMTKEQIKSSITFCNDIVTSDFIKVENNNGWGEIICQIPNKCRVFKPAFREIGNLKGLISTKDVITTDVDQIPSYDDNGNKTYSMENWNEVLDIDNSTFDDTTQSSFEFNVLLLFYRDKDGVDKLHGINFIYPFENKDGGKYWEQETFVQKTNIVRSIGYQFIFNLKTCNNEASKIKVYDQYKHIIHWNGFENILSGLGSFLELKMRESGYENGTIPHIFGE